MVWLCGHITRVWLFFVNDSSRSSPSCLKNTSSKKMWNKSSLVQTLLKILHIFLLESTALEFFLFVSWSTPYHQYLIKKLLSYIIIQIVEESTHSLLCSSFHFNIPFLCLYSLPALICALKSTTLSLYYHRNWELFPDSLISKPTLRNVLGFTFLWLSLPNFSNTRVWRAPGSFGAFGHHDKEYSIPLESGCW